MINGVSASLVFTGKMVNARAIRGNAGVVGRTVGKVGGGEICMSCYMICKEEFL